MERRRDFHMHRFNIIADKVTLKGTIRALDPAVRRDRMERMARTVNGGRGAHLDEDVLPLGVRALSGVNPAARGAWAPLDG
jgi:hypothetical protein